MKKRKKIKKKKLLYIITKDFIKAIKKANREAELSESVGWKATEKVHKSKKQYSRHNNKKIELE